MQNADEDAAAVNRAKRFIENYLSGSIVPGVAAALRIVREKEGISNNLEERLIGRMAKNLEEADNLHKFTVACETALDIITSAGIPTPQMAISSALASHGSNLLALGMPVTEKTDLIKHFVGMLNWLEKSFGNLEYGNSQFLVDVAKKAAATRNTINPKNTINLEYLSEVVGLWEMHNSSSPAQLLDPELASRLRQAYQNGPKMLASTNLPQYAKERILRKLEAAQRAFGFVQPPHQPNGRQKQQSAGEPPATLQYIVLYLGGRNVQAGTEAAERIIQAAASKATHPLELTPPPVLLLETLVAGAQGIKVSPSDYPAVWPIAIAQNAICAVELYGGNGIPDVILKAGQLSAASADGRTYLTPHKGNFAIHQLKRLEEALGNEYVAIFHAERQPRRPKQNQNRYGGR